MKKVLFTTVLLSIMFAFIACNKDDLNLSNGKVILTFSSIEDVSEKLANVITMSSDELRDYEESKGYISYGRKCEEIFQSVDFDSFQTQDEIFEFVAENSDYLELVTDQNGDVYLETKLRNNEYRYIVNEDKMYVINDRVYKVFNEGEISTKIENREALSNIIVFDEQNSKVNSSFQFHPTNILSSSVNIIDGASLKSTSALCGRSDVDRATNGRDRTKIEIDLKDKYQGSKYIVYHKGLIRPYKRTLGIWYWCSRTITYQWKYTGYANILGYEFREGEDRSGSRSDSKEESYKELFFAQDGVFTNWYYEKYDCWGDTPSTDKAQVKCGY